MNLARRPRIGLARYCSLADEANRHSRSPNIPTGLFSGSSPYTCLVYHNSDMAISVSLTVEWDPRSGRRTALVRVKCVAQLAALFGK
jgi:hypothetical protein